MDYGRDWVLRRHSAEYTRDSIEEERLFMNLNPHADQLRDIFQISGIQYGRIDYSVLNGQVQTWEINTLPMLGMPPNVMPVPDELAPLREEWSLRLFQGYARAMMATATQPHPEGEVDVSWDPEAKKILRDSRRPEKAPPGQDSEGRYPELRTLLRPAKRVLKPIAGRTLLPFLARRARARFGK